jgi:hypothetical protein
MKKVFLVFAIVTLGFTVNAQEVTFGVKAGLNLASIAGDDTDGLDSRTSFHVGGVAEISISEKFSVQPELLYSAQGAKYTESDGYDGEFKLDYINLPIMAKYYVADGFSLEAGPQVGFLLSAKDEYTSPEDSGTDDLKDFVKGIDFGLNFGVGYKLDSGLNFGARYNLGLSNIWDFGSVDPGFGLDDIKNQNSVIQFSVGYFF